MHHFKKAFRRFILSPKKQILIFSILGFSVFVLLTIWEYLNEQVSILSQDSFIDLNTVFIQINTITVGLLTAFFFFWMQALDSKRQMNYLEFKNRVDKLIEFRVTLKPLSKYMEKPLLKTLHLVLNTSKNDFPYQKPQFKILEKSGRRIIEKSHKYCDSEGEYVFNIINDLGFYASEINMCFIELTIAHSALISIKKQIMLIVCLLTFGFIASFIPFAFTNILTGISVVLILLTLTSFLELYTYISDYYRELDNDWHRSSDENNDA